MNINRFRMTASEIAMGHYMRAPDHPAANEFADAFAQFADKDEGAAAAAPPAGGEGDGATGGAAAGSGGADDGAGGSSDGSPAADAGDTGAAPAAGEGAAAPEPPAGGEGGPAAGGEPAAGDAGGDAGAAAGAGDGGAAKSAAAAASAVPAEAAATDAILDRLTKALESRAPAPAAPAAAADDAAPPPIYSAEEQEKITKYRSDFPDEAEAIDLMNRQFGRDLIQYVFDQIRPVLGNVKETVDVLAAHAHTSALESSIEDYNSLDPVQVKNWIEQQPKYLQKPMLDVITAGTAEDVADLIGRYREANGLKPAGAPAAGPGASGGETELSGAAKKAAAALAPVGSKRSVTPAADDTSDFEGSFSKWASEFKV